MTRETGWLTAWGHLALKHWEAHRPKMAAALEAEGRLVEAAKEAQCRAQEEFGRLVETGSHPEAARETVLRTWILLPSETETPKLDPAIDPALLAQSTSPSPTALASEIVEAARTRRYWSPVSVESNLFALLAVENTTNLPMGDVLHRQLMEEKVVRLFEEAGPDEAQAALEMSVERAPELWSIRSYRTRREWPQAVMDSDIMMTRLHQIDWGTEISRPPPYRPTQEEVAEILAELTLRSLLEAL